MGYRNTWFATYDKPLLGSFKLNTLLLAAASTYVKEKKLSSSSVCLANCPLQWKDIFPHFYADYLVRGMLRLSLSSISLCNFVLMVVKMTQPQHLFCSPLWDDPCTTYTSVPAFTFSNNPINTAQNSPSDIISVTLLCSGFMPFFSCPLHSNCLITASSCTCEKP